MPGPALVHLGGVRRFGGLAQPPRWVKVAPPVSSAGVGVPGLVPAYAPSCPHEGAGGLRWPVRVVEGELHASMAELPRGLTGNRTLMWQGLDTLRKPFSPALAHVPGLVSCLFSCGGGAGQELPW